MAKGSGQTSGGNTGKPSSGQESRPIDLTHSSQKGLPGGHQTKVIRPDKKR